MSLYYVKCTLSKDSLSLSFLNSCMDKAITRRKCKMRNLNSSSPVLIGVHSLSILKRNLARLDIRRPDERRGGHRSRVPTESGRSDQAELVQPTTGNEVHPSLSRPQSIDQPVQPTAGNAVHPRLREPEPIDQPVQLSAGNKIRPKVEESHWAEDQQGDEAEDIQETWAGSFGSTAFTGGSQIEWNLMSSDYADDWLILSHTATQEEGDE